MSRKPGAEWPRKELEKWDFKARPLTKGVFKLDGISGHVEVEVDLTQGGYKKGVVDIQFDQTFVDALGHHMQFGVSCAFPVFLRLIYVEGWYFIAQYEHMRTDPRPGTLLWVIGEQLPKWAEKIRWLQQ